MRKFSSNEQLIYSLELAGILMQKGFICFDVVLNEKTNKYVYIFNKTKSILKEINMYRMLKGGKQSNVQIQNRKFSSSTRYSNSKSKHI